MVLHYYFYLCELMMSLLNKFPFPASGNSWSLHSGHEGEKNIIKNGGKTNTLEY